MTCSRLAVLAVVSLLAGALPAAAQNQFFAQLRGYEEAPSVSSTGSGVFAAVIDDAAQTISFQLFYSNLEGQATFAHIHVAQRAVNGGIVAFLCGGGGQLPCPPDGGVIISGTITAANIMGVSSQGIDPGEFAEVAAAIRGGVAYANVHTTKHGSGEVRGQIRPTPPPPPAQ